MARFNFPTNNSLKDLQVIHYCRHLIKKISSSSSYNHNIILYLSIFLIAFALRAISFGTQFFAIDEDFYLFVGGRILSGDLPFVDVWDRKPIGIFILYAFFHLFGAWRFWAYQIGATLSAGLTAVFIMRSARFIAPVAGSFIAAILYLGWINTVQGGGGQTPVFYNTLISYAIYLIISNIPLCDKKTINNISMKVMLLFGIAIQIKSTVVFEGMFSGLFLVYCLYRKTKSIKDLIIIPQIWIFIAILPTLLCFLFYSFLGYSQQWIFANIESIFEREKTLYTSNLIIMIIFTFLLITPLLLHLIFDKNKNEKKYFILLWSLSAWFGVFIVGDYFKHYFLPLFVPFFIAFSPLWTYKFGKAYLLAMTIIGLILGEKSVYRGSQKQDSHLINDIKHIIDQKPGCLFNYSASSSLQEIAPYCHLTPYIFPGHLSSQRERNAIGVNQIDEINHVFSQHPLYVLTLSYDLKSKNKDINFAAFNVFNNHLKKDYTIIYKRKNTHETRFVSLYKLKNQ